jgi:hypothetical protein
MLDHLNREYPDDWSLRSSIKRKHQIETITESKAPQYGVYWWRPSPISGWVLESFFVSEFGPMNHYEIWHKWAGTILGVDGVIPIEVLNAYCGIPRGRVTKQPSCWVIRHGGDLCSSDYINQVISDFNLPSDKCDVRYDKHEDMVPEHVKIIEKFLGLQNLNKP